jgi:hypothetical protein
MAMTEAAHHFGISVDGIPNNAMRQRARAERRQRRGLDVRIA